MTHTHLQPLRRFVCLHSADTQPGVFDLGKQTGRLLRNKVKERQALGVLEIVSVDSVAHCCLPCLKPMTSSTSSPLFAFVETLLPFIATATHPDSQKVHPPLCRVPNRAKASYCTPPLRLRNLPRSLVLFARQLVFFFLAATPTWFPPVTRHKSVCFFKSRC